MSRVPKDNSVPLADVERFVRILCHDWRNILNGIDLHLVAVGQAGTPEELETEIRLARTSLRDSVQRIHRVGAALSEAKVAPIAYPAAYFVEDLQTRLQKLERYRDERFVWKIGALKGELRVDFDAMADAAAEIFENALLFSGPDTCFEVEAEAAKSEFLLRVTHFQPAPAIDPKQWGAPFVSTKPSRYGLGLYRARRLVAAHGGELNVAFDSGRSICSIRLPILTTQ
ncbi:MAG TPA: ATP-binding protein [Chthoniobacterales bacterium]